jgi:hypothetical protein
MSQNILIVIVALGLMYMAYEFYRAYKTAEKYKLVENKPVTLSTTQIADIIAILREELKTSFKFDLNSYVEMILGNHLSKRTRMNWVTKWTKEYYLNNNPSLYLVGFTLQWESDLPVFAIYCNPEHMEVFEVSSVINRRIQEILAWGDWL